MEISQLIWATICSIIYVAFMYGFYWLGILTERHKIKTTNKKLESRSDVNNIAIKEKDNGSSTL